MHVGKSYPYHPSFWGAPAWFWPGFIPWKMHGVLSEPCLPPFNIMPYPWENVSTPGEVSADGSYVDYTLRLFEGEEFPYLALTLDKVVILGEPKARWRCSLRDGQGSWGTAFLIQDYPQRQVLCPGFQYVVPAPPYTGSAGPKIVFRPATYDEGGTPFPNY